ncbi:hypothetical protein GlitD10_0757 [Gloeomargarita lithophora Alchichica-D10]|uniref:DUF2839 family protein n=1 Tax=Gloeomargarita lithophora Alchichica-D10 TaxID=1188229 RepID=A0A1J0AAW5_9CYAN|nr:DUF2839 domain-containing protein [Gloeomargarita lithophora]APB33071.1 hypothetical protein GlitD10_0757 [Gloeomargarita lithophora Alchichica-D10]
MGEAKRRQAQTTPTNANRRAVLMQKFITWTTWGAWAGIFILGTLWVTVRFIGPGLGWWQLAG